jgi:K+-sensing histidine kinase KdpD
VREHPVVDHTVRDRQTDDMLAATRIPAWVRASLIGVAGIAIITAVFTWLLPDVPSEVSALLLLVPITIASVISSWRVGLPIAVLAAFTYAFVLLPPFGEIHIGYTEEAVILVTFSAVALIVSVVVSRRSIANRAELIGHERMLLLRSVSHDLRSPLNAILAASTDLQSGADYDPIVRKRLLGLIVDETRRLDRIVDNLLGLSRLQAGALVPAREPVAVSELVEHCRSRFALIGNDEDTLSVMEPLPDIDVDVDPVQIDQVLTNLVENAVVHAHGPVNVTVSVAARDPMVEWRVCDDGPGFSPTARASVFEPFRSTAGSSGLGLTLCKAIVEAHGGALTIDDLTTQGASIRFTVPRAH